MKYRLSIVKEIGRFCTTCFTYLILFITVLSIYENCIPTPLWLLGIPFILICYQVIEDYCFQPLLYILFHGIFFIPVLLIPFTYIEYRYLFLLLLVFEGNHAVQVWKTQIERPYESFPWPLHIAIGIICMIASGYHLERFAILIYYLGVILILIHFIRLFITGFGKILTKTAHATSIPTTKIMLTNCLILTFFLILLIGIALFIPSSNIDTIVAAFGEFIVKGIRFILRLIAYISTIIAALFAKNRKSDIDEAKNEFDTALEELSEPSLLAQIIEGVLMIGAIFFLTYLLYRVILSTIKSFTKRYSPDLDVVVSLSKPQETVKLQSDSSFVKRVKEFFSNDNATKIRRGYRLRIKSYKPTVFKTSDTPSDIAKQVKMHFNEDISELTTVYEKARYSTEEITFDDVQKGGLL